MRNEDGTQNVFDYDNSYNFYAWHNWHQTLRTYFDFTLFFSNNFEFFYLFL